MERLLGPLSSALATDVEYERRREIGMSMRLDSGPAQPGVRRDTNLEPIMRDVYQEVKVLVPGHGCTLPPSATRRKAAERLQAYANEDSAQEKTTAAGERERTSPGSQAAASTTCDYPAPPRRGALVRREELYLLVHSNVTLSAALSIVITRLP